MGERSDGLTLNALGGNAFIWKFKHNVIHHTYTKCGRLDDDIAKSPFMRGASPQSLSTGLPADEIHRQAHVKQR